MEVGLGPDHIVLDWEFGTQLPPKRAQLLQSSAHVCCGQTAAWIKVPFGTEICLGPGDIVLDGEPAPHSEKGAQHPHTFWPMSSVAKRLDGSRCDVVRR